MNYNALLKKVEDHVNLFFTEHTDARLFFHNYSHTKDVAVAANEIAVHYQLDDRSWFVVCTAAWFHDTGYLLTSRELHEPKSAELAEIFLKSVEVSEEEIAEVKKCILATKMPQMPETLPEKIICDADLFYLGTDEFKEKSKRLKKEEEAIKNSKIDANEWRTSTIKFLEEHSYHTDYCRTLLDNTKAEQLEKIKNKQREKLYADAATLPAITNTNEADNTAELIENKNLIKKPKKKKRPRRGIETMFRISTANNVRVSAMADNKAHIMITVNSIIISVILGMVVQNIDENRKFILPTIILLLVNVLTIIYSILATKPKMTNGVFTSEQVKNKSVNLLFYGSYFNMNFPEYNEAVKEMMKDSDFLYGSLTKDIFWQGKVLGRKYRYLAISYTIFLYGLVAAVIAFAIAGFIYR